MKYLSPFPFVPCQAVAGVKHQPRCAWRELRVEEVGGWRLEECAWRACFAASAAIAGDGLLVARQLRIEQRLLSLPWLPATAPEPEHDRSLLPNSDITSLDIHLHTPS